MNKDIKIPFELKFGIMLISGQIAHYNGYFIFDTGCQQTAINQQYYQVFNPNTEEVAVYEDGIQKTTVVSGLIKSCHIGNLKIEDYTVLSIDLSETENELQAEQESFRLLGIMGMDLISQYTIRIDYAVSTIFLNPTKRFVTSTEINFDLSKGLITTSVQINGKEYCFIVDSGANACLVNEKKSNSEWKMIDKEQEIYEIPELLVGKQRYHNIPAVCEKSDILDSLSVDGIIGYPILSEQRLDIDFQERKIYFEII